MLGTGDFTFAPSPAPAPIVVRRIPLDADWPTAPAPAAHEAEVRIRPYREQRSRLQTLLDGVAASVALVDECGDVVAVNRAWRLTAKMQGMTSHRNGVGMNYLAVCGIAAAEGNRDAAIVAEGIDGVLQSRNRSFYYKYRVTRPGELQLYALLAWRLVDGDRAYVAVSHELLESHATDPSRG